MDLHIVFVFYTMLLFKTLFLFKVSVDFQFTIPSLPSCDFRLSAQDVVQALARAISASRSSARFARLAAQNFEDEAANFEAALNQWRAATASQTRY